MVAHVAVLGPVVASVDGVVVEIPRGRARALLVALAAAQPRSLTDDEAVEHLWHGAPPASAIAVVRNTVARLRELLGGNAIRRDGSGYHLAGPSCVLDVDRFDALCDEARARHRAGDATAAIQSLDAALALVRGRPYDDIADEDFARPVVAAVSERILLAEELWAEVRLRDRHVGRELDRLQAAAQAQPLREIRWRQAIEGYWQAGRRTEGLRLVVKAREALAEYGMVAGEEIRELERRILASDEPLANAVAAAVGPLDDRDAARTRSLPVSAIPLFGRTVELDLCCELLATNRLVTIVGGGGLGKTRLAVEAAALAAPTHGGCALIDLAVVRVPELVAEHAASALGAGDGKGSGLAVDRLLRVLRARPLLIVLDNAEHVSEAAAALVATMLAGSADVRVLATSRTPLRLAGEALVRLGPLSVPDELAAGGAGPAVEMLRALLPDVERTPATTRDLARIVRRLDGVPLALELVARITRALGPADVADELDRRGRRLLPIDQHREPRQRSLDDVFAWTLQQLNPSERLLFARMSVLAGAATLGTVDHLVDHGDITEPVGASLARVVELDLVESCLGGPVTSYRLRSLQRDYAATELMGLGEFETMQQRRNDWYVAMAHDSAPVCRGDGQAATVARLDAEWDNLRLVIHESARSGRWADAADMATELSSYCFIAGRWSPGVNLAEELLAMGESDGLRCARLVVMKAECVGTYAGVARLVDELSATVSVLGDAGDFPTLALAHLYLAAGVMWRGEGRQFWSHLACAEELAEQHSVVWVGAGVPKYRGLAAGAKRDFVGARTHLHESKRRYLAIGDRARAANVLLNLGMFFQRHGDAEIAEGELLECLRLAEGLPMRSLRSHVHFALAQIAGERGDERAAAQLWAVRDDMLRQGDIGCAHGCSRNLAMIFRRSGDDGAALGVLRELLEAVADVDQQELAMSFMEIADIYERRIRTADAAILVAAAQDLATRSGIGLNEAQRAGLDARVQRLRDIERPGDAGPFDVNVALAVALT